MTTPHPSWVAPADRSLTGRRRRVHRSGRRLAARLGAVAALAATAGVATTHEAASAAQVSKTFTYACNLPIVGVQPIPITLTTNFPDTVAVGQTVQSTTTADVLVPANVQAALPIIQGVSADLDSTLHTLWSGAIAATVDGRLSVRDSRPPASGEWKINGVADYPALDATAAGAATVKVGDIDLVLTVRKADGSVTALGVVNTSCQLDAGQDTTLATITITGGAGQAPPPSDTQATTPATQAPASTTATTRTPTATTAAPAGSATTRPTATTTAPKATTAPTAAAPTTTISDTDATVPDYGGLVGTFYKLGGRTIFNRINGETALGDGKFKALLNLENGLWFGEFEFPEMELQFRLFGLMPVRTSVLLQQVDPAYGKIDNGVATALAKVQLYVRGLQVGRLRLPTGTTCTSTAPLDLTLASGPNFNPLAGGRVSGAFVIPTFADCGLAASLSNRIIAGPGNRLELDLTPTPQPS